MGVTSLSRAIREFIVWIIGLLVIIVAFYGIVQMKNLQKKGFSDPFVINLKRKCPNEVSKKAAYFDHLIENYQKREGLMHCYCLNELI